MKILVFSLLAIGTLALTSCKENKEQKSTTETSMQHDMSMMSDNSTMGDMPMDEKVTVIDAKKLPQILQNSIPITPTLHLHSQVMMIKKQLIQPKEFWKHCLK